MAAKMDTSLKVAIFLAGALGSMAIAGAGIYAQTWRDTVSDTEFVPVVETQRELCERQGRMEGRVESRLDAIDKNIAEMKDAIIRLEQRK